MSKRTALMLVLIVIVVFAMFVVLLVNQMTINRQVNILLATKTYESDLWLTNTAGWGTYYALTTPTKSD